MTESTDRETLELAPQVRADGSLREDDLFEIRPRYCQIRNVRAFTGDQNEVLILESPPWVLGE